MNKRDILKLAAGNLRRHKTRTSLTVLGVVIGIAALSAMVSFGLGLQKNVTGKFSAGDLFTSLTISPVKDFSMGKMHKEAKKDTADKKIPLTDSLVEVINKVPGVKYASPQSDFVSKLKWKSKEIEISVSGISSGLKKFSPYNDLLAGTFFQSDSDLSVLISPNTFQEIGYLIKDEQNSSSQTELAEAKKLKIIPIDSVLGKSIDIISLDLNMMPVMPGIPGMSMDKDFSPFKEKTCQLKIVGVLKPADKINFSGNEIIAPIKTATRISGVGFSKLWDVVNNFKSGTKKSYNLIQVKVNSIKDLDQVKEKLEKMKLNVFSFADKFKDMKQFFLIINTILGAIGSIALVVAGLGISNTMIMSILERTREIGIMKALGAEEKEIRLIFFFEAGFIGLIGAILGLTLGWVITRFANMISNAQMPIGSGHVQLFDFSYELIIGSVLFSILISLLAGMYPASKAAKVDPVEALRHD